MKKIALEEHFLAPGLEEYWGATVANVPDELRTAIHAKLKDFGEVRLGAMDAAGIERAVLSAAGPGVQAEPDAAVASRKATEANDFLAEAVARRPDRYSGFGHIALQDPQSAVAEVRRCMGELGFAGVMINGHTNGRYLDEPKFAPFWEAAEEANALVYLHPADPVSMFPALEGYPALRRATWEWTLETGSHVLRLVFSGLFDRFPKARLGVGHLGETLPYLLWRLDSRAQLYGVELARKPSDYIRDNIIVTTSGMSSAEPFNCALSALGAGSVLFAADYPFEEAEEAGAFLDTVGIDESVRRAVAYENAERILPL